MKYKARLVARGFEEDNLSNIRKDSPTCCKDNFRLTLSIIISNKWIINSVDVTLAFLQGKGIDRDIYLKLVSAIFYQIYSFSSNDSALKTMKNVFYFI